MFSDVLKQGRGGGSSPERTALRPDSLLSGINTGIFHGLCRECPGIIRQSSWIQGDFSRLPL